jgi:CRISPR/Cas system-associated exonuclease Cas4 (RecB family)
VTSALPLHMSHSQLTGWAERCQKAFQLERIQRAPKVPAWWLVGGSAVHEVTEELDRRCFELELTPSALGGKLEIEELTHAKLDELVAREVEHSGVPHEDWFAAGRSPQNRKYWYEQAPVMVGNYLTWRERTNWKIAVFNGEPAIEFAFDLTPSATDHIGIPELPPAPLKGAPDRVFELPNGELVVGDVKSGSSTPKSPLQLGVYATVIEYLGFRRPKYGTFIKVKEDGGVHTPLVPLKKYDHEYVQHLFTALRSQLDTGTFIPNVGDNCRTCSVQAACYAAGGSLSADYDPLDPQYQGVQ